MVRSAPGARERAELAEARRRLQQRDAELARANASLASMQARVRALEAEVEDLKATAGEDDEDGCNFSEISEQSASTLLSRYSKRIFRYLSRYSSNDICELVARALRMFKWEGETEWEGETAMHGIFDAKTFQAAVKACPSEFMPVEPARSVSVVLSRWLHVTCASGTSPRMAFMTQRASAGWRSSSM